MSYNNSIKGLYCVIDSAWVALDGAGKLAEALVDAGVGIVQLRAKDKAGSEVLMAARAVRKATEGRALFIVNDRVDVAMLSGADGVHLGQDDIPALEARRLLPSAIIGVSTHDMEEAARAEQDGADYISFGPIFPTRTKKDADVPKGLERLREMAGMVRVPVVAIGGMTAQTAAPAIEAGASAVAIISGILLSGDAGEAAASVVARLRPVLEARWNTG